jgi:integrase
MNTVQPLKNKKDIEKMKKALGRDRDRLLFIFGINSALRISDILKLKVGDVRGKEFLSLREQKTKKERRFPLNQSIKKAIAECVPTDASDDDFLFPSRKGGKAIGRGQAYQVLNDAAKRAGLLEKVGEIGSHSLRKTFGYHAYKSGVDISLLQSIFNHASPHTTLRYIGITQTMKEDVFIAINL